MLWPERLVRLREVVRSLRTLKERVPSQNIGVDHRSVLKVGKLDLLICFRRPLTIHTAATGDAELLESWQPFLQELAATIFLHAVGPKFILHYR
jgi:hypothetical protein